MKLVKMSLLAATLVASSAFAIDNVKVAGDAKLFYSTADANDNNLFSKGGATGQVAAKVGLTADLTEGVSAGVSVTALSTLGLQGRLVNNIWEAPNGLDDYFWFDEAWVAGTYGKTTAKVGRMSLDTPLVFTETWSIVSNTFEAGVLINQDIPDTTLVGAYVGGGNGGSIFTGGVVQPVNANGTTNFSQFYDGAYAAGAINNSWSPLTVQAWYYKAFASHVIAPTATLDGLDTYWAQADLSISGVLAGVQYTAAKLHLNNPIAAAKTDVDATAFAGMIGYAMEETFTAKIAYSQVGKDHGWGGNLTASGQSKLYTEAWWNYGYITRKDTSAMNFTVETDAAVTMADLGLYVTQATTKDGLAPGKDAKMLEATLSASKSFGPLDTSLVYILTDADDQNLDDNGDGQSYNTIQAYLTYNF